MLALPTRETLARATAAVAGTAAIAGMAGMAAITAAALLSMALPAAAASTAASGVAAAVPSGGGAAIPGGGGAPASDPRESHFADLSMLTHGGQNAEAYWSPDGRQLIFQSTRPPFECDQIFRMPADGSGAPALVSTGKGRTTCSYFMPDGQRVLYSSTHAAGDACPPAADRSRGYVWAVYPAYDIWTARPDGSDLRRLTDNRAYDAETTVCGRDGSLIFTSDRDGDLDLYRMDADGGNVRRLTSAPGYDGGAFFSPDCTKIVWRASRPQGAELEDYRRLLAQGLVRPGKLELWVANADGSDARQLTYLDAASFAPSFFPSGDRVIFSSNFGDPQGREFELWAVNLDGSGLERITWSPGFDGFPMFSPDGSRLAFSSNRGQSRPHETNVFVARWVDAPRAASGPGGAPMAAGADAAHPSDGAGGAESGGGGEGGGGAGGAGGAGGGGIGAAASGVGADGVLVAALPADAPIADRFRDEVRWLADPAREGRGIGSAGLDAAARWLAERFREIGALPAGAAATPAAMAPGIAAAAGAAGCAPSTAAGCAPVPEGAALPAFGAGALRTAAGDGRPAPPGGMTLSSAGAGKSMIAGGATLSGTGDGKSMAAGGAMLSGAGDGKVLAAGGATLSGAGDGKPAAASDARPAAAAHGDSAKAAYFQELEVVVALDVGPGTSVAIDGAALARSSYQPAGFSASTSGAGGSGGIGGTGGAGVSGGTDGAGVHGGSGGAGVSGGTGGAGAANVLVSAGVVAAGYGIAAPELGIDDYRGVDARGKIVAVRRFTPRDGALAAPDAARRYGDLRRKAYTAREHGALGLIVVDLPEGGAGVPAVPAAAASGMPDDAPLPAPEADAAAGSGDAGIPVVVVTRAAGARLFAAAGGPHRASLAVELVRRTRPAVNVVAVLRAGAADRLPGAVVVGAHYDHLGLGGHGSLAPDSHQPHLGADDNASGTAALLEVGRILAAHRDRLRRDVYLVAFSGEEEGTLGSIAFTRHPPDGLRLADVEAMLNMDMVGRLRGNQLSVLGGETAAEWRQLVPAACARELLACTLGGDGYGPSDHSPLYAAGVPVLHFFTGTHDDYHKPSDTPDKINAIGGARVALLVADVAREVAAQPARLTYKAAPAPAPAGDVRSYGASLGTVPDYAGDGRPGVLIGGVRPEGAAERAGIRRGDLLIELGGTPIRDIYDFMYVLQRSKPGDTVKAVIDRAGTRLDLVVTLGASQRPR